MCVHKAGGMLVHDSTHPGYETNSSTLPLSSLVLPAGRR